MDEIKSKARLMNDVNKLRLKNSQMKSATATQLIAQTINEWLASDMRKWQGIGKEYYIGNQDILEKQRWGVDENGRKMKIEYLDNNIYLDNQYAKMIDQKVNYLLGEPFTFTTGDDYKDEEVSKILGARFKKTLKTGVKNSLLGGIGWIYPYLDSYGDLKFKSLDPLEICPFWLDAEKTQLQMYARVYNQQVYEGNSLTTVMRVDLYTNDGIYRFNKTDNDLIDNFDFGTSNFQPYIYNTVSYENPEIEDIVTSKAWGRLPIIPIKYNEELVPVIKRVKSLQDGINTVLSNFGDRTIEDARSTILVIHNYGGTDLGMFRRNLSQFGAVNVESENGRNGGLETLNIEVNVENYREILKLLKKALIENARGFDAKDERVAGGNPNQMNIMSAYSDLDLDANQMETELQVSLEDLTFFIDTFLDERLTIDYTFKRSMLINETEIVKNINDSYKQGTLSLETISEIHPYASKDEYDRIMAEQREYLANTDKMDNFVYDMLNNEVDGGEEV